MQSPKHMHFLNSEPSLRQISSGPLNIVSNPAAFSRYVAGMTLPIQTELGSSICHKLSLHKQCKMGA